MQLNLGCGTKIKEGFTNIDCFHSFHLKPPLYIEHDLTKGLPTSCKDVGFVYSEHFLEHLSFEDAVNLLKDCRNKMLKGGRLRIVVPDMEIACRAYINKDHKHFEPIKYASPNGTLAEYINYSFYGEQHRFQYDYELLSLTLDRLGFDNVTRSDYIEGLDSPERRQFSLYVEAING